MKRMYGYIRVSTVRQGMHGVSLDEQREAISRYAERRELEIIEWFEEQETAAKRGRPVFGRMLKQINAGKADGVIIHKIDRSARNLKDWADLGQLIDNGIEVHFAHESLDLNARGGRLAADIQAVVAADFIRNLRDETRKGIYGRLKQGVFPFAAPTGYLNAGAGQPKVVDPHYGPMVRHCFERYATGRYSLHTLRDEITSLGYRTPGGKPYSVMTISKILNNPFYYGLMVVRGTGETFEGAHAPIVSKKLFDQVAVALTGKYPKRSFRHDFVFSRVIRCGHCKYSLIGEIQKGRCYYRCHTKECPTTSLREDFIDRAVERALRPIQIPSPFVQILRERIDAYSASDLTGSDARTETIERGLAELTVRFDRLTDAYLDNSIDKDTFERRKSSLLNERKSLESDLRDLQVSPAKRSAKARRRLEQLERLYPQYISGDIEERREAIQIATSNRTAYGKNLYIERQKPFDEVAEAVAVYGGDPLCRSPRTKRYVERVLSWFFDT